MKNIQTKFFEELQSYLDDKREGELIVNFNFANQGRGYIQRQGGFENISVFTFQFNTDYATFTVNGKPMNINFEKEDLLDVISEILKPVADPIQKFDQGERIAGGDPAAPRK